VELEGLALRHRSLIIRAVMAWSACGAGRTDTPVVPASSGRIEIVLANRRRVIVDGGVDIAALCQLVEALERR
jgi:hypothetical protein